MICCLTVCFIIVWFGVIHVSLFWDNLNFPLGNQSSVRSSIHLFIRPYTKLPVHLSMYSFMSPCIHPPTRPSFHPSSTHCSICPSSHSSILVPICPSIHPKQTNQHPLIQTNKINNPTATHPNKDSPIQTNNKHPTKQTNSKHSSKQTPSQPNNKQTNTNLSTQAKHSPIQTNNKPIQTSNKHSPIQTNKHSPIQTHPPIQTNNKHSLIKKQTTNTHPTKHTSRQTTNTHPSKQTSNTRPLKQTTNTHPKKQQTLAHPNKQQTPIQTSNKYLPIHLNKHPIKQQALTLTQTTNTHPNEHPSSFSSTQIPPFHQQEPGASSEPVLLPVLGWFDWRAL